jgi:hypothetical protein
MNSPLAPGEARQGTPPNLDFVRPLGDIGLAFVREPIVPSVKIFPEPLDDETPAQPGWVVPYGPRVVPSTQTVRFGELG